MSGGRTIGTLAYNLPDQYKQRAPGADDQPCAPPLRTRGRAKKRLLLLVTDGTLEKYCTGIQVVPIAYSPRVVVCTCCVFSHTLLCLSNSSSADSREHTGQQGV